jgi:energy-coupling factor transporter transmembrane protein EcfT
MFYIVLSQYPCDIEIVIVKVFYTNTWRQNYQYLKYFCCTWCFVILVFVVQTFPINFFLRGKGSGKWVWYCSLIQDWMRQLCYTIDSYVSYFHPAHVVGRFVMWIFSCGKGHQCHAPTPNLCLAMCSKPVQHGWPYCCFPVQWYMQTPSPDPPPKNHLTKWKFHRMGLLANRVIIFWHRNLL